MTWHLTPIIGMVVFLFSAAISNSYSLLAVSVTLIETLNVFQLPYSMGLHNYAVT